MYKVVTPVATEPVSLAEARTHMRLTADDPTDEDALITIWITAAREMAEHYTGRALATQTLETALDCFPGYAGDWRTNAEAIELPMAPVASVTYIKYDDTAGDEQTLSSPAYSLSAYGSANSVYPTYGNYWPSTQDEPNAVRIRAVHGYSTPPKAVKSALLLMVAWMHEHRGDEMDPSDIQPPAAKALLGTVKDWSR